MAGWQSDRPEEDDTLPTASLAARVASMESTLSSMVDGMHDVHEQLAHVTESYRELMAYVSIASGERVDAMRDASRARAWTRAAGAGAAVWLFDSLAPFVGQMAQKWMGGE